MATRTARADTRTKLFIAVGDGSSARIACASNTSAGMFSISALSFWHNSIQIFFDTPGVSTTSNQ